MRLIPCARLPVLFLGTASGVLDFEVGVVVCARCDLMVVRQTRRYGGLVAGVPRDGGGGVTGVSAFKCDLKADAQEFLLEIDNMVVVGSAQNFFFDCCSPLRRGG